MVNKFIHRVTLFTSLILAQISFADEVTTSIIEFSPGAGYFNFDSGRNLEDEIFWGLGLGLHFSRNLAALLHYSRLNTALSPTATSGDIDIQKYHLDGMYFFYPEQHLRPFIVLGYGQIDLEDGVNDKTEESIFNGGVGLHYRLTANWSVRADVRNFHSLDESHNDQTIMMTVGYRVAEGEIGR